MRILIVSFYFPPDLSAGSFRTKGLVQALESYCDKGIEVDVITTNPNRYASIKEQAPALEDHGWLRVHRIDLPSHKSGMLDQAFAFVHFARKVRRMTGKKHWDVVFATSSRLMTATLGAHIARRMQAPLYLDIRDLFTETMDELLAGSPLKVLLPVFRAVERITFRSAARINIVSKGFASHIKSIAPLVPISCYTNGIDDIFLDEDFSNLALPTQPLPVVLYAGNMGDGQALHRVVPQAAKALEGRVLFRLIGDGGKRAELDAALSQSGLTNVEVILPVKRERLLAQYREADILFLHLSDLRAFRKVLPSKLFEYAATGKPILAGVAGYAAQFLVEYLPDAEVFAPCDVAQLVAATERLLEQKARADRQVFCDQFARRNIMPLMAAEITRLGSPAL